MTYECKRFLDIISKVGGEDLFNDNEDGTLSTSVHTGKLIEELCLGVFGVEDTLKITTSAQLSVNENNVGYVGTLLLSLKERVWPGLFYISEKDRTICFQQIITLNKLAEMENPFDAIFYGCDMFDMYGIGILKALSGSIVFVYSGK